MRGPDASPAFRKRNPYSTSVNAKAMARDAILYYPGAIPLAFLAILSAPLAALMPSGHTNFFKAAGDRYWTRIGTATLFTGEGEWSCIVTAVETDATVTPVIWIVATALSGCRIWAVAIALGYAAMV